MAFDLAVSGVQASSAAFNKIAGYFNGSSSYEASPITLITLNDATNYVQAWKNLDGTNGLVGIFYKSDGTVLARVTKDGFRFSPNGVIEDLTPVSLSGTEAITGAKTFTKLLYKLGTSTASTASLTLPTDGNIIPITGTATITSISSTSYTAEPITLQFASAGCTVKLGATGTLNGDYISVAGGTLTLYYDGSAWHEITRGAYSVPSASYRLSAATTSIVQNGDRTVTWTVNDRTNGGISAAGAISVSSITPGIIGRWNTSGLVLWDDTPTGEVRIGSLFKNGSLYKKLFGFIGSVASDDATGTWSRDIEVSSITDAYSLVLFTTQTNNILGGSDATGMDWTYIGR